MVGWDERVAEASEAESGRESESEAERAHSALKDRSPFSEVQARWN